MPLQACSVSRSVRERLPERPQAGQIVAAFERACAILLPDSSLISLVLPEIGDGPLNIVVDGKPGDLLALDPGDPASADLSILRAGGMEVALDRAVVWEPRPNWNRLRRRRDEVTGRLPLLLTMAQNQAPQGSLLMLLAAQPHTGPAGPWSGGAVSLLSASRAVIAQFTEAHEAAETLRAGWEGEPSLLRAGAARLAGLGAGLTPAADDFLTGLMLWAWLAHPAPSSLCQHLLETAGPRTTTLSAAFLTAAAAGECNAAWHRLLDLLAHGDERRLAEALQDVLAYGQTSGADALAGFLWMGLRTVG